ncbi:MAG: hypothetical protein ACRDHZ_02785 [Ktedonobacteraceae bacterium]
MSVASKKPQYLFIHPSRIVETVQKQADVVPVQQFKVLFPIWDVQIIGNQREGQDYGLLERFIERGIGQGGLRSAKDLTKFFQIPENMLEKMLTYLRNVRHLEDGPNDSLLLTPLGQDSIRDEVFYTNLETHRTLYFEGYGSQPLLREHYDLTFLTEADSSRSKEYFHRLFTEDNQYMRQEQVFWLAQQPDRATKYNLPDEIKISSVSAINRIYLPISIIEARQYASGNKRAQTQFTTRYLVMSHIRDWHDTFLEEIVNREPAIANQLREHAEQPVDIKKKLADRENKLGAEASLEQAENGIWQVLIDADVFNEAKPRWSLSDLGNFRLERGYFLQIWCHDEDIRRKAALEQTLTFVERQIKGQRRVFRADITRILERNATALHIEQWSWALFETYVKEQDREEIFEEIAD